MVYGWDNNVHNQTTTIHYESSNVHHQLLCKGCSSNDRMGERGAIFVCGGCIFFNIGGFYHNYHMHLILEQPLTIPNQTDTKVLIFIHVFIHTYIIFIFLVMFIHELEEFDLYLRLIKEWLLVLYNFDGNLFLVTVVVSLHHLKCTNTHWLWCTVGIYTFNMVYGWETHWLWCMVEIYTLIMVYGRDFHDFEDFLLTLIIVFALTI